MRIFGRRVDPSQSGLLQPPTLYRSDEEGRHTTWLEHFFDLVYVFALAQIAHFLHEHLTVAGFFSFVFLFVPVWYAWIGFSYYSDQFDTDDVPYRLTIVAAMFGSIALALTLGNALDGGAVAFAASYIFLRVLLIGLYVRAWRSVDEAKQLCAGFVASFSLGTAILGGLCLRAGAVTVRALGDRASDRGFWSDSRLPRPSPRFPNKTPTCLRGSAFSRSSSSVSRSSR